MLAAFCPHGSVPPDLDDTLFHKSGRQVDGAAWWRDAVRSTAKRVVHGLGLNLVVVQPASAQHKMNPDDMELAIDDPKVVEIGDLVTVRFGDGSIDSLLIVHPVEAPLDDIRVSFTSSFAQALLGSSVGDRIEFERPDGTVQGATIARAVRV